MRGPRIPLSAAREIAGGMGGADADARAALQLGLRPNLRQFALLVLVNAFVGAVVGCERAIVPLLGERVFAVASSAAVLSFVATFGAAKAVTNLFAGPWSDRVGRRRVLIAGWLVGLPVPFLVILAPPPHWWIVVAANVLLGVNQGLCWSMTVVSKIDLVGPARRGFALGLNEFAGYLAVGAAAFVTAYLASVYGLRPVPFLFMFGATAAGLALSIAWVRETLPFARLEATQAGGASEALTLRLAFATGSYRDRTLMSCSQAGLVNNLNDGIVWGLVPLMLVAAGADLALVGLLVALYPVTWGLSQLITGAASDRLGRKRLIVGGMLLQGASIALLAYGSGPPAWAAAMVGLGLGTAAVYPTLLSTVGDVAPPAQRAALVGVYRFWRDAGYPVGALIGGLIADAAGIGASLIAIAAVTGFSGIVFGAVARETLPDKQKA